MTLDALQAVLGPSHCPGQQEEEAKAALGNGLADEAEGGSQGTTGYRSCPR